MSSSSSRTSCPSSSSSSSSSPSSCAFSSSSSINSCASSRPSCFDIVKKCIAKCWSPLSILMTYTLHCMNQFFRFQIPDKPLRNNANSNSYLLDFSSFSVLRFVLLVMVCVVLLISDKFHKCNDIWIDLGL
eukprot:664116_1